jgi:hypothetical protein
VAVHGCVRVLTAAVVAVMVAVGDASRPPASGAGVGSGLPTPPEEVVSGRQDSGRADHETCSALASTARTWSLTWETLARMVDMHMHADEGDLCPRRHPYIDHSLLPGAVSSTRAACRRRPKAKCENGPTPGGIDEYRRCHPHLLRTAALAYWSTALSVRGLLIERVFDTYDLSY